MEKQKSIKQAIKFQRRKSTFHKSMMKAKRSTAAFTSETYSISKRGGDEFFSDNSEAEEYDDDEVKVSDGYNSDSEREETSLPSLLSPMVIEEKKESTSSSSETDANVADPSIEETGSLELFDIILL